MSDHTDHGDEAEEGRVTSPMQEFSTAQVSTGIAIFVVGLIVTFVVPLLG